MDSRTRHQNHHEPAPLADTVGMGGNGPCHLQNIKIFGLSRLGLPFFSFGLLLSMALVACESTPRLPSPAPAFANAGLPGDWIPDPKTAGQTISFTEKEGIPALKITATSEQTFSGRRLNIALIASPYLRWSWYLETTPLDGSSPHISDATARPKNPMRLRIAFHGGSREEDGRPASPWRAPGIPSHDRLLDLIWEWQPATRTQGGDWRPVELPTTSLPKASGAGFVPGCSVPCIVVRNGLTDSDQWWLEAADLEKIYKNFWPEDHLTKVRVVFVAFGVESSPVPMAGYLADLAFHR